MASIKVGNKHASNEEIINNIVVVVDYANLVQTNDV